MEFSKFLKSVEVLSDLNDQEIECLAQNTEYLEYPERAQIIKRGEIGRFLWIIYEGEVEVTLPDIGDTEKVIATLERGDIFGEMSIMTGEPAIANVTTSLSTKLLKIPRESFSQVIAMNYKTLSKVTRIITKRLLEDEKHEEERERRLAAYQENEDPYDLNFSSVAEPMKILVVNCGNSSLKYSLFDTTKRFPLIEGIVEKMSSMLVSHKFKTQEIEKKGLREVEFSRIGGAFNEMISVITNSDLNLIKDLKEIDAVGHRVVHGGNRFTNSQIINRDVIEVIKSLIPIAPLHNPYNLEGIEVMQKLLPDIPHVAVFDTSFHQSIPKNAFTYAIPLNICKEEQIRRYGFHGTSHRFVALSAATFIKKPVGKLKIISCHLGSGASVCAIDHGRSIDTSMGMTPMEGLIMGTRAGDIDAGVILHLMRHRGMTHEQLDHMLNKESGLKGISGKSDEMKIILKKAEKGDAYCELAISSFCYRVKKYIGSYIAALGGLDVLIFTGGIGENSSEIRARICQSLEVFGIVILDDKNRKTKVRRGQTTDISEPNSKIRILVISTDEEKMISRETIHTLGRLVTKDTISKFNTTPIRLSTSAHHVHLSETDFEILFGKGKKPTPKSELSQPGQFAATETVNLIGPKGRIEKVRILGPLRKESQVEISRTEQFKLGIDAPIRDSGDIEGTPGITIEGKIGTVKLDKGLISAKRHIHMSPEEALDLGLRDKDVVLVKVKGVRELIFGDVVIRVHPNFRMDMHLDTDEANAAQISPRVVGYIDSIQHRNYT